MASLFSLGFFLDCVGYQIAFHRYAINKERYRFVLLSVRIVNMDVVSCVTEASCYLITFPLAWNARTYMQSIVGRFYAKNKLRDGIPVPCSSACEPAVLCFARACGVSASDHL